jgi:hypothetical protein
VWLAGATILLGLLGTGLFWAAIPILDAAVPRGSTPLVVLLIYGIPLGVPAVAMARVARRRRVGAWGTVGLAAGTCLCVATFAYLSIALALSLDDLDSDPYGCPDGKIYC